MFNTLRFRLSVCRPLQDVRTKFKIALYVKYKLYSVISHLCLWLQQSWLLYMKLNRTIATDCHIGIITFLIRPAYRLVEPWNSLPWESLSHGLPHIPIFLYHEFSIFVTFLSFRDDKTVKNKGHGLLGFYISNLSNTRTISTTRGSSILARLKCS